jgi:hypothetical protein
MAAAGRDFSQLEITSLVENRALAASDIRAYRDIGVTGLYVIAQGLIPRGCYR